MTLVRTDVLMGRACIKNVLVCISIGRVVSVSVQPTPTSEPSADMKRRMREEYLGLGGSPNKVRDGRQCVELQSLCQSAAAVAAAAHA